MTDFSKLGVFRFDDMIGSVGSAYDATTEVRLPRDLSLLPGIDTVTIEPAQASVNSWGLHPSTTVSERGPSVYWSTIPDTTNDMASWVRFRLDGNQTDYDLMPVTRMDNTNGDTFYGAELTYNAAGGGGSGAFDVAIVKYVAGTRHQLAILADVFTAETGGSALANRYVGLGIRAIGSGGSITVEVYARNLFYVDAVKTYNADYDLDQMSITGLSNVLSVVDNGSVGGAALTGAEFGFAWDTTASASEQAHRVCNQFGVFKVISSTAPNSPTILSNDTGASDLQGQKLKVVASAFSDSDALDTHDSTRWLLYDDGDEAKVAPIFDSGFLSGSLTEYTFDDVRPLQRYMVRVQHKDNDGDISDFGELSGIIIDDQHSGQLHMIDWKHRWSRRMFPRNGRYSYAEFNGGPGLSNISFQFDHIAATDERLLTANDTPGTGFYGLLNYRDPSFVTGGTLPVYDIMLATAALIKWDGASGIILGTRCTASHVNGYYVKKTDSGANWTYEVFRRTGGPTGTDTSLFSGVVRKTLVGKNGERVVLASYDVAGTKVIGLFVNGMEIGTESGANAVQGYTDPGHQWSQIQIDEFSAEGDWYIEQYGQVIWSFGGGIFPEFRVYADEEDSGQGTTHHPGPLMDPFDLNQDNYWWMNDGVFRLDSSGGTTDRAFLVYANPRFAHYDFSTRGNIWGNNGLVARFQDPENYIAAYIDSGTTLKIVTVINGVETELDSDTITVVDGSLLILSVYDQPDDNGLLYQVHYNGAQIIPSSGAFLGQYAGGKTQFPSGRPGFGKFSGVSATADEKIGENFQVSVTTSGTKPTTPSMSAKTGETCATVSLVLQASSFVDADAGDTHAKSQFQVLNNISEALIWDSGEITSGDLTQTSCTPLVGTWVGDPGLLAATTYKARVRYQDSIGLWSDWSDVWQFTTGSPSTTSAVIPTTYVFPADPPPSQAFTETAIWKNLVTTFEGGSEQRRQRHLAKRRVFRLRYRTITNAKMDILWDFFNDTARGRLNAFLFIHPETGEALTARFLSDSMSRENFEAMLKSTGLEIYELLGE